MVWTSSVHLATAQQDLFVSGQVVDSTSKKPLEYCTVRFANEKEELITGGVTDERGYFEAALPRGKYHIIIDFLDNERERHQLAINLFQQLIEEIAIYALQSALLS